MLALFWRLARAEVAAHMGQLLSEVELRSEVIVLERDWLLNIKK
jgi:hypothetical protein